MGQSASERQLTITLAIFAPVLLGAWARDHAPQDPTRTLVAAFGAISLVCVMIPTCRAHFLDAGVSRRRLSWRERPPWRSIGVITVVFVGVALIGRLPPRVSETVRIAVFPLLLIWQVSAARRLRREQTRA